VFLIATAVVMYQTGTDSDLPLPQRNQAKSPSLFLIICFLFEIRSKKCTEFCCSHDIYWW